MGGLEIRRFLGRQTHNQITRYLSMTAISAGITLGVPVLLHEGLSLDEEIAVALALGTAFIVNFVTMRRVVFRSSDHPIPQLLRFAITNIAFRIGEYLLFVILHTLIGLFYMLALGFVLVCSFILKFLCYRVFVFMSELPSPMASGAVSPPITSRRKKAVQIAEIGGANRTYHEAQSQMELLPNYYAWIYGVFRRYLTGQVIELGCGGGIGIATYVDRVDRVYAVDHNAELLRRVVERLPKDRVTPIQVDLCGAWTELDGLSADTVILMDVLEHFADDVEFLRKAEALLKPGGHLAIKVPAQSALYSAMDRASGHFRRYDHEHLLALADELGLRVVSWRHLNWIGGLAYRFRNKRATNFSRTFTPTQLKAINLVVPLIRLLDVLPGLPGLSLAIVLQRRMRPL